MRNRYRAVLVSLIMVLFLVAFIPLAFATNPVPGGGGGGGTNDNPDDDCPSTNHIVEPKGNLNVTNNLIYIEGGGPPLNLYLQYNSNNSDKNGPFGYGWNLNLDSYVVQKIWSSYYGVSYKKTGSPKACAGWSGAIEKYIEIHEPDGDISVFYHEKYEGDGSQVFSPKKGSYEQVVYSSSAEYPYTRRLRNGYKYYYGDDSYLGKIEDPNGNTITINRNEDGEIQSVVDNFSAVDPRTVQFEWDGAKIDKIIGPGGSASGGEFEFQYSNGDLISSTFPGWDDPHEFQYDDHKMVSRSSCGGTVEYDYNDEGLISWRKDRNGYTRSYLYAFDSVSPAWNCGTLSVTTVTYPPGNKRVIYFDDTGKIYRLYWTTSGDTVVEEDRFYYGASGQLISHVDGEGNRTRYVYDLYSNLREIINAQGVKTSFTYDTYHNAISVTAASNYPSYSRTIEFDYGTNPEKHNLEEVSWEDDGSTETFEIAYNANGQITSTTNPLSKSYSFTYNQYGNVETVTDPLTNEIEYDYYDVSGKLKSITDKLGFETTFNYIGGKEWAGLASIEYPDSTFTKFSSINGVLLSVTDRNDNISRYLDHDGELNTVLYEDAEGNFTAFSYYGRGFIYSSTDANENITTWTYDEARRLKSVNSPDSSYEEFSYDLAGNLVSRRLRNGNIVSYKYDSLNRLEEIEYPDETEITMKYDVLNRLSEIKSYYYTISYLHDSAGRVSWVTTTDEELDRSYVVGYEYNADGTRSKLIYPSQYELSYTYDDVGRINEIKNSEEKLVADYEYDALRKTHYTLFNSGTEVSFTNYTYDNSNNRPFIIKSLTNWNSNTVLSKFTYNYDDEGNIVTMEMGPEWASFSSIQTYTYDKTYQLDTVTSSGFTKFSDTTFSYDSMGNRLLVSYMTQTTSYEDNNLNQYTEVDGKAYNYDENGNLICDQINTYYYDYENRLTKVIRNANGQSLVEYRYDPFGRRAKKIQGDGEEVNYLYDNGRVIEERDDNWGLKQRFIYGIGIDDIIAMYDESVAQSYFYSKNSLGSIVGLHNEEGIEVEHYRYSPFGETKYFDASWNELTISQYNNTYLFAGRRIDIETNHYHYRARVYVPKIGRFLQADPVGLRGVENLYTYVNNNPINYYDPFGLESLAIYDGSDPGGDMWTADGEDFESTANNYDHYLDVSSIEDAIAKITELKRTNPTLEITELIIIDHGGPAAQSLGNNGDIIDPKSDSWKEMAALVDKCGIIILEGCRVASGARGNQYIYDLAKEGDRRTRGYTGPRIHRWWIRMFYEGGDIPVEYPLK